VIRIKSGPLGSDRGQDGFIVWSDWHLIVSYTIRYRTKLESYRISSDRTGADRILHSHITDDIIIRSDIIGSYRIRYAMPAGFYRILSDMIWSYGMPNEMILGPYRLRCKTISFYRIIDRVRFESHRIRFNPTWSYKTRIGFDIWLYLALDAAVRFSIASHMGPIGSYKIL